MSKQTNYMKKIKKRRKLCEVFKQMRQIINKRLRLI